MGEDIDEFVERVADEEAADAPGFGGAAVFDGEAGGLEAGEGGVEVVDFDGEVGGVGCWSRPGRRC